MITPTAATKTKGELSVVFHPLIDPYLIDTSQALAMGPGQTLSAVLGRLLPPEAARYAVDLLICPRGTVAARLQGGGMNHAARQALDRQSGWAYVHDKLAKGQSVALWLSLDYSL